MDAMGWVAIAGVLVGGATLGVTIPVLVLTRRQERRSTERSIVEWVASEPEAGLIRVRNQGLDPAYEVTAEVWDRHDVVADTADVLTRFDELVIELPHRRANGPDRTDVPKSIAPRVPDEPPAFPQVPGGLIPKGLEETIEDRRLKWELAKAMQDGQDATWARLNEQAEADQVAVRVAWRSAMGAWSTLIVALS